MRYSNILRINKKIYANKVSVLTINSKLYKYKMVIFEYSSNISTVFGR